MRYEFEMVNDRCGWWDKVGDKEWPRISFCCKAVEELVYLPLGVRKITVVASTDRICADSFEVHLFPGVYVSRRIDGAWMWVPAAAFLEIESRLSRPRHYWLTCYYNG